MQPPTTDLNLADGERQGAQQGEHDLVNHAAVHTEGVNDGGAAENVEGAQQGNRGYSVFFALLFPAV